DDTVNFHGFLRDKHGVFTAINYPGATDTQAYGINDSGDIVGTYRDTAGLNHGFLLSKGTFSTIDFPGAGSTSARGINSSGDIVGTFAPGGHSFLFSKGA